MSSAAIVHPALAQASFRRAIQPLLAEPGRYRDFGVHLVNFDFPYLDVDLEWRTQGRVIRLRVDGTDFPYRPVGGWWIDSSGQPLSAGTQRVPIGYGFHVQTEQGAARCWFCWHGWRAYHDHSSHQDTSWASIRSDGRFGVLRLVVRLVDDLNRAEVQLA